MRSDLILFVLVLVLVLVNQNFIRDEHENEDEDDDEGDSCRAVAQRAKTTNLTSVICLLSSEDLTPEH